MYGNDIEKLGSGQNHRQSNNLPIQPAPAIYPASNNTRSMLASNTQWIQQFQAQMNAQMKALNPISSSVSTSNAHPDASTDSTFSPLKSPQISPMCCPVCLCAMIDTKLFPCGHEFHGRCIERWLQQSRTCPFCRVSISKKQSIQPVSSSGVNNHFPTTQRVLYPNYQLLPTALRPASEESLKATNPVNSTGGLRRGKWTPEEEAYANRLIEDFRAGILPLADGTTLRTFLSKLLNCDPMRISKKFVGPQCIGKQVFKRRPKAIEKQTPEEMEKTRQELIQLEGRFLERLNQQWEKRRKRAASAAASAQAKANSTCILSIKSTGIVSDSSRCSDSALPPSLPVAVRKANQEVTVSKDTRNVAHGKRGYGEEQAMLSLVKLSSKTVSEQNQPKHQSTDSLRQGQQGDSKSRAIDSIDNTPSFENFSTAIPRVSSLDALFSFPRVSSFDNIMGINRTSSVESFSALLPRVGSLEQLSNWATSIAEAQTSNSGTSMNTSTNVPKPEGVAVNEAKNETVKSASDNRIKNEPTNSSQDGLLGFPRISSFDSISGINRASSTDSLSSLIPRVGSLEKLTQASNPVASPLRSEIKQIIESNPPPPIVQGHKAAANTVPRGGLPRVPSLDKLAERQKVPQGHPSSSFPRPLSLSNLSGFAEVDGSNMSRDASFENLSSISRIPSVDNIGGSNEHQNTTIGSGIHRVSSIEDILALVAAGSDAAIVKSAASRSRGDTQEYRSANDISTESTRRKRKESALRKSKNEDSNVLQSSRSNCNRSREKRAKKTSI